MLDNYIPILYVYNPIFLTLICEVVMTTTEHLLIEKILQPPPTRLAEAVEFVDFIRRCKNNSSLTSAATQTAAGSFSAVWDNDANAAYDSL